MKKPKPIEPGNYNGIQVRPAWNKLAKDLRPLDFFCTQGAGFLGWGIRQITKNLSPDRQCEYNHAGIIPEGTECTLEALWTVKPTNLFEHYEGSKVLIARYILINKESTRKALASIIEHIDQPYPTRRLLLHLFNFAHHIHWINAVVCSELVAKALFNAGARDYKWWGVTPDNLADDIHFKLNKDRTGPRYKIIYEGKLPWMLYKFCVHCGSIDLVDLLYKRCHRCSKHYLDDVAIPDRNLSKKIKEYNFKKIDYIGSLQ